jgi:hypothetical protein
MRVTATAAAVAFLLLPALVRGQEPVKSFDQLNTRLKVGDKIIVTDSHGREHEGRILVISPSALTLDSSAGQLEMSSDVQLVQDRAHDSLKNGALIGLACGLALGGLAAADCAGGDCEFSPAAVFGIVGGIYGGIGAAIGTGIDALIPGKKRVVYRAADGQPATRVLLSPVVTGRAKGVALSVVF